MPFSLTGGFRSIVVMATCSFLAHATLPESWQLYGSARQDYEVSTDPSTSYNGAPSTCLKSRKGASLDGFAGLQPGNSLDLEPYRGKRVRFSANIKAQDVTGWTGLWMRVNGAMDRKNRH